MNTRKQDKVRITVGNVISLGRRVLAHLTVFIVYSSLSSAMPEDLDPPRSQTSCLEQLLLREFLCRRLARMLCSSRKTLARGWDAAQQCSHLD